MQKNISFKQNTEKQPEQKPKETKTPREILVPKLGYRGLEVLQNAESQFPNETKIIVEKLAELIKSGEIDETLDGGKLLLLFRSVGLNIRMETKINIEQDGKFVSLSDKLSKQSLDDGEG
ncbi:DNA-binding protein [Nitrosopumilus sp. K4]|uniref:DNA-binding protein n=1 Tax=Nitrosopumilus sp. K4 TaxID=2795383 RepID=UPI0035303AC2